MKAIKIIMAVMMLSMVSISASAKKTPTKDAKENKVTNVAPCPYQGCTGFVSICGYGVRIRTAPSLKAKIIGKAN